MKKNIGAIVLAAGKGSRMNSKDANKVTLSIDDKPMIVHTVALLEQVFVSPIVIVVGFAKQSVMNILGEKVLFAEQTKRLGTAHAALKGLQKLPADVENVLVLYGDDSAFYKASTIESLIAKHFSSQSDVTFLTIEMDNPEGLGRVVRDKDGKIVKIVEEKDATPTERQIQEVNPACYIFSRSFLEKYLPKVAKSPVTGEYYLTSLIDMAIVSGKTIHIVQGGDIPWRGVNTKEELEQAQKMFVEAKE